MGDVWDYWREAKEHRERVRHRRIMSAVKELSKDRALELASRPQGFRVHKYKYSHDRFRRQFRRYFKEGLVSREFIGKEIVFRKIEQRDLKIEEIPG